MEHRFDYDFFVIGAGSGGVRAARMAGGLGARVGIAEERYFGGTCVNVGCIPKKLFVYGSRARHDAAVSRGYGWLGSDWVLDWPAWIHNKDREIGRLNGAYRRVLENAGCAIFEARATVVDGHTVALGDRRVTAQHILIATGGWPHVPAIAGREFAITSNEAFHLPNLPQHIVIVGGGYIAVEFAGIFAGFGCKVAQIYRGDLFLRGFDTEIRHFLATQMRDNGIDLRFNQDVRDIRRAGSSLTVNLKTGESIACDCVMYATGRRPNSADLGLAEAGVELDRKGAVKVDEEYRTTNPSIYAVGDVTNRVNLTPVALAEGMIVARRLFGGRETRVDYDYIPTAVFSQPPIGTVGFTEDEARERFGTVSIYTSTFTPLRYTVSEEKESALMKLVVATNTNRVVGIHLCGEDAGEITQGFAVAMRAGATKEIFDSTIGIHPTAAEELVTMRDPVR